MGSSRDSQLEDENHIRSVFKHVVQGHDVGVLDLLQDVHLPLDLLSFHAASAGPALPLLDELGGVLDARASVLTALDDRKLAAAEANAGENSRGGHLRERSTLAGRNESTPANHGRDIFHRLKCRFSRRRAIPKN